MYPYEIRHAIADPQGAAEIALTPCFFSIDLLVWGKKSTKCFATQMGPTPGPPPPCGIEKVLCKFRWQTSAPIKKGLVRPTWAFILAPSIYTCPPWSWIVFVILLIDDSKTPWVEG